jgi:hypothetical protein
MKDTTPEVAELFRKRPMALSGELRLKIGCSRHETARRIVIASLRPQNPNIGQTELSQARSLRFSGKDFEPETVKKILQGLST